MSLAVGVNQVEDQLNENGVKAQALLTRWIHLAGLGCVIGAPDTLLTEELLQGNEVRFLDLVM